MAIFHLRVRTVARGSAASAAASAAYICRIGKYGSGRLDPAILVISGNMPSWAKGHDRLLAYWRSADQHERANGRLFKSLEFALPLELCSEQRSVLALDFCKQVACTDKGEPLPFLMAIHRGKDSNPHVHLMISERINDGHSRNAETWFQRAASRGKNSAKSGAKKSDSLKSLEWLSTTRELLARLTNTCLERAGFSVRVDHRSHLERGIQEAPGQHLGPSSAARMKRGGRSPRAQWQKIRNDEQAEAVCRVEMLRVEAAEIEKELGRLRTEPSANELIAAALAKRPRTLQRRIAEPKNAKNNHDFER